MAGHSKWNNIKRKKAAVDAKKNKIFTKIIRELMVAARMGGGDPEMNSRLRLAIDKAKSVNMPKDNIKKAIKKGTGELGGQNYEELSYEGYGPAGVAVLIKTLTDNKNRTASAVRSYLTKHSGNLGENGCVSWLFHQKGVFTFENIASEDDLTNIALEIEAEDYKYDDGYGEIFCEPDDYETVKKNLDESEYKYSNAEITMIPDTTVTLDERDAEKMLKIMDSLEDDDDVQDIYTNYDIPDEIMEKLEQ